MSATPDPSRAVTVPVPLTDIEAAARHNPYGIPPSTVLALCEALRIAVEGLVDITRDPVWPTDIADDALTAVRKLVDLGEKP